MSMNGIIIKVKGMIIKYIIFTFSSIIVHEKQAVNSSPTLWKFLVMFETNRFNQSFNPVVSFLTFESNLTEFGEN